MGQNNCKPQPGDLIEIDRPRHKHWALYMEDGYVINLTPVGKGIADWQGARHFSGAPRPLSPSMDWVKKQRLEVVQNNTWRVNNESDQCHPPLTLTEIIHHAKDYIDKDFTYRVFGSNCEDFVKKLRYGEGVTEQVSARGEPWVPPRAAPGCWLTSAGCEITI
uniref:Uncharacterized protein n=1 Tax=Geospiza parvula TaxID=87175 RepID=A0A8C3MMZ3_GEOPR